MQQPYRYKYVRIFKDQENPVANINNEKQNLKQSQKQVNFQGLQVIYLQALERQDQKHQHKLKQLSVVVHAAATKIQRFWRRRKIRRRLQAAIRIQRWWLRQIKKSIYKRYVVNGLRRAFATGVIRFALKRFVRKCLGRPQEPKVKPVRYFNAGRIMLPYIKQKLTVEANLEAQACYMANLRMFNQKNFNQQWQMYEKRLVKFINTQIQRQWLKKDGKWIDQSGKIRDRQAVISRQVQKIFNMKYETYQQNQQQIHKAILNIESVVQFYNSRYVERVQKELRRHRAVKPAKYF